MLTQKLEGEINYSLDWCRLTHTVYKISLANTAESIIKINQCVCHTDACRMDHLMTWNQLESNTNNQNSSMTQSLCRQSCTLRVPSAVIIAVLMCMWCCMQHTCQKHHCFVKTPWCCLCISIFWNRSCDWTFWTLKKKINNHLLEQMWFSSVISVLLATSCNRKTRCKLFVLLPY